MAEDLRERVEELERELAAVKAGRQRCVRRRATWGLGDIPFYDIAMGGDPARGELRGHAKGIIAVGDIATGVVALGGWARGVVALGGLATGLISLGGLSIGLLLALGGGAIGGLALGGGAVGGVALGGGAAGYYACGGGAAGKYVVSATRRDPEAMEFFESYGLEGVCPPQQQRGRWR